MLLVDFPIVPKGKLLFSDVQVKRRGHVRGTAEDISVKRVRGLLHALVYLQIQMLKPNNARKVNIRPSKVFCRPQRQLLQSVRRNAAASKSRHICIPYVSIAL